MQDKQHRRSISPINTSVEQLRIYCTLNSPAGAQSYVNTGTALMSGAISSCILRPDTKGLYASSERECLCRRIYL